MGAHKYTFLCDKIADAVISGKLRPGMKAPSENELISKYGVSATTVKSAYGKLINKGIVQRRRGSGTFITEGAPDILKGDEPQTELAGSRHLRAVYILVEQYDILNLTLTQKNNLFVAQDIIMGINDSLSELRLPFYYKRLKETDSLIDFSDINPQDGVVMIHGRTFENIRALRERRIPFVAVNYPSDFISPSGGIESDDRIGIYEAVEHLAESGCKSVAMLYPSVAPNRFNQRLEGFKAGVEAFGIDSTVISCESQFADSAYAETEKLLKKGSYPDAMIAATDFMAFGCMRAIKEKGLNVPEDISVVGFDDNPEAAKSDPPLTTVRKPRYEMGQEAVRMLLEMFKRPNSCVARKVLKTSLVIRNTVRERE